MRRNALLALTLLMAASAALFLGQTSASAQPVGIQVYATGPGTYQVLASFNTDEIPVTFTVSAPGSGITASVSSVSLVSCSHPSGSCTTAVPDVDTSATAYSSGSALQNFDAGAGNEPVSFVVSVTLTCSEAAGITVVASQGGSTLSAPLTCGYYAPYAGGYNPYFSGFYPASLYANPGYVIVGGRALVLNGGSPFPGGVPLYPQSSLYPGQVLAAGGRPYLGAGFGAFLSGGSGTERNLARHAAQQVAQQLPQYLAAYGIEPALSAAITQQVVAYINASSAKPPSVQQIIQQVTAYIQAYSAIDPTFSRFGLGPPRTGEAGLADPEYAALQFPFLTYAEEVPVEEPEAYTEEVVYEEAAE